MNRSVLTMNPEQTLEEAAQYMIERQVGSAVVVSNGAVVGIVTERDVMRAVARGLVPWNTKLEEVMTREPITASPDGTTAEAAQVMLEHGFRHLPVVEGTQLVGIVSLRDVLIDPEPADTS
ncbi:MAG: CBS domain-containing protein [Actinomycetota bacterium]